MCRGASPWCGSRWEAGSHSKGVRCSPPPSLRETRDLGCGPGMTMGATAQQWSKEEEAEATGDGCGAGAPAAWQGGLVEFQAALTA